jgi:hypothetical protein
MPSLLTKIANSMGGVLALPIRLMEEANLFVYSYLGTFGQLAFDLILLYVLCLIAFKVTKAVFDVAFYVVIPSVAVSLASSFVLPFAFASILPVCVVLLIVVNILRT